MIRYILILLLMPLLAQADNTEIASLSDRGLRMTCAESADGTECTLRKRRLKVFNVFSLSNPSRLVVDVSRMPKGKSKYIQARAESTLTQVRTGWHPEKYRIVFDISSELSSFSWEKYGDVSISIDNSVS